jgi:hypothetical protein
MNMQFFILYIEKHLTNVNIVKLPNPAVSGIPPTRTARYGDG